MGVGSRVVSVPVSGRSFRTELTLRFIAFFKHIEPCIYVCLSSYENVVPVSVLRNGNIDCDSVPKKANLGCVSRA
jgi:hypothetical protein